MSGRFSDTRRAYHRAQDMLEAISNIRAMLGGRSLEDVRRNVQIRAAFERFIEIISEASRHLPNEWKTTFGPQIEWVQIRDIGNILRHGYDKVNDDDLWGVYENDLDPLQLALERMIAAHGPAA